MRRTFIGKKYFLRVTLFVLLVTVSLFFCACKSGAEQDAGNTPSSIPILTYHKIVASGTEFESGLLIDEDTFEEQMKYLHDSGFTSLTLDELYDWYHGGDVPEKSVVITFDDGFYGTYYLAYPIIKKYDMAATVFCIGHNIKETTDSWSEEIEPNHYIGADVIETMRQEYPRFSFESHTYDMHNKIDGKHPVDVFTYEQMVEDINKNSKYGFRYLAYPWGDYNETMEKALSDNGYKMAFNYGQNYYASRQDDLFAVNRIKISGKMKMKKFKRIVNQEVEEYINPNSY